MHPPRKFASLIVVFATILFAQTAATADDEHLTEGVHLYSAGKYDAAWKMLCYSLSQNPKDAVSHYWLGMVLVRLHKFDGALHEFRTASALDPQGDTGPLAERAITMVQGAASAEVLARKKTLPQVKPGAASSVVPSIVPASVPEIVKASVTDPHALTFTLNKIDEQAQAERSRHGLARTNLTNSLEKFDTQTALLQLEAKNAIADMRSSYLTDKHGQKYPLYTEADIAAKQSEYDERIALLTQRQRLELQQAKDLESVSSNELDKSVEGLKSQFAKPANSQSVLLPSGTNLYVRNYLMNEQAAQPQGKDQDEMVASQDRMVLDAVRKHGAPVSHIVHESLSAQQDKLSETSGSRSGDAQMKVKGRLLPTPSGETR